MCSQLCSVLLVEDHLDLREVTASLLEASHIHVVQAENGRKALHQLQKMNEPPTAILLDLMMPEMNGWEFLQELHKHPGLADIPVIILSAVDDRAPKDANIIGRLTKPAPYAQLLEIIHSACNNQACTSH